LNELEAESLREGGPTGVYIFVSNNSLYQWFGWWCVWLLSM